MIFLSTLLPPRPLTSHDNRKPCVTEQFSLFLFYFVHRKKCIQKHRNYHVRIKNYANDNGNWQLDENTNWRIKWKLLMIIIKMK